MRPRASGFMPRETLSGGEWLYGILDVGMCPPRDVVNHSSVGAYPEAMPWDGRAWMGPSDFSAPKGDAFPPGTYTFAVELRGTQDGRAWRVEGRLPITLVEPSSSARSPEAAPPTAQSGPPPTPPAALVGPEARACETTADCVIACDTDCCGAPCGCSLAVNKRVLAASRAWAAENCDSQYRCPAMGCRRQEYSPVCREGQCRAVEGLGLGP